MAAGDDERTDVAAGNPKSGDPASGRPAWMGPPSAPPPGSSATGLAPPAAHGTVAPGAYPAPWGGLGWWDGSRWWQLPAGPGAVRPFAPIAVLGRVVQALLVLTIVVDAIDLVVQIDRFRRADELVRATTLGEVVAGNRGAVAVALASGLLLIVTAIVFLVWRYRVQQNLVGVLAVPDLEFTPGESVVWWFVPIANLWKPKQAMDEAWRASDPLVAPGGRGWTARRSNPTTTWWWAAWIGSFLVTFRFPTGDASVTADAFRRSLLQEMAGLGLTAVAAYLAIQIVGEITDRQRTKAKVQGIADA